ncbi:PREDICTED: calcium uniporter protein 2, mitochondrial-like [Nelumbo nucifera]|uniref:Calcium uniporter protein 2, mitochondrial-like n=2 Tax=Nelumbo nucifera TaxID=4432 RepID=A0A1U8A088_NELNU|nr:PREDICTED: calcium uniporter protein 2, mitochondrial-like [Nelumbo nucifera]DAD40637.1 TPA_asm: hypothetical protein HUJ06_014960 [Nelumbo nucifera]
MAFRKTLAHRLFNITKISSPNLTLTHAPASSPSFEYVIPANPAKTFRRDFFSYPDSGENGFFRRFLQKRAIVQSAMSPEFLSLPIGDKLMEKLRGMTVNKDRLRLDGLAPPATRSDSRQGISIEDARKLLVFSQLEKLKSKLRRIPDSSIPYSEFIQICIEGCSSPDQGRDFAKMLDQSGVVIVLGDSVFLRPEEVAKMIESVIPISIAHRNNPRRKELEQMEKEKMQIDEKAEMLVRRELWAGLGFLIVQTAGFMRLTFWELSWDVMEPICFYVTSIYFMLGYAFFLKTSRDPSFEGFFESRFSAKQQRLMRNKNFDMQRFNELRRACYPSSTLSSERASSFDNSERTLLGSFHH